MFYQDGWVPLCDVAYEVFFWVRNKHKSTVKRILDAAEREAARAAVEDEARWELLCILEDAAEIRVLLASGGMAKASKRLVLDPGSSRYALRHYDPFIGTVGSAVPAPNGPPDADRQGLEIEYGPFLGLPILLPEVCMERAEQLGADEFPQVEDAHSRKRKGGRPRKKDDLLIAYLEVLREGRGTLTAKEVARELKARTGIDASIDTVRAVIKEGREIQNTGKGE